MSQWYDRNQTVHVPVEDDDYMNISDVLDDIPASGEQDDEKPTPLPSNANEGVPVSDEKPDEATDKTAQDKAITVKALERRLDQMAEELDKKDATIEDLTAQLESESKRADDATKYANHMKHDLMNYKRRAIEEQERNRDKAIANVGKSLMPIIDDFERVIEHYSNGAEQERQFADGCSSINRKLLTALERLGITQIDPTGEEFDPETSMAISQEEREDVDSNTVFATYQKGYKLNDKVIRNATVGVAK